MMDRQSLRKFLMDQIVQTDSFYLSNGWNEVARFHFTHKPTTASRPRVSRWKGTTYTKSYESWREASLEEVLEQVLEATHEEILTGELVVTMAVAYPPPKKGEPTNVWPIGDLDNYAKGPMDTITKLTKLDDLPEGVVPLWLDDTQVVSMVGVKYYEDEPELQGIHVVVYSEDIDRG